MPASASTRVSYVPAGDRGRRVATATRILTVLTLAATVVEAAVRVEVAEHGRVAPS